LWIEALEDNEKITSAWLAIIPKLYIDVNNEKATNFWRREFVNLASQIVSNSHDDLRLVKEI